MRPYILTMNSDGHVITQDEGKSFQRRVELTFNLLAINALVLDKDLRPMDVRLKLRSIAYKEPLYESACLSNRIVQLKDKGRLTLLKNSTVEAIVYPAEHHAEREIFYFLLSLHGERT